MQKRKHKVTPRPGGFHTLPGCHEPPPPHPPARESLIEEVKALIDMIKNKIVLLQILNKPITQKLIRLISVVDLPKRTFTLYFNILPFYMCNIPIPSF